MMLRDSKEALHRVLDFFHSHDVEGSPSDLFDLVLDCIGEGIAVADKTGKLIFFNPMAEKILGLGVVDAPSSQWSEKYGVYFPDQTTPVPEELLPLVRAIRGEVCDEMEMFIRNAQVPSGVFLRVTGRPLRNRDGQIQGGVVVFRDVTEQRRAEESKQLLASIVESSEDGIISWNLDKIITGWNRGAEKVYGYSAQEAIGLSAEKLLAPEHHHEIDEIISSLKRGHRVEHYETQRFKKDGSLVDVSISVSPVYDTSGRMLGASSIARDITERKRSQKIMKEVKSRFSSMITRELTIPLSNIRENVNSLADENRRLSGDAKKKALEAVTSSTEWLERLINNLLSYSQIESDSLVMYFSETDVSVLLANACRLMEPILQKKGLCFEWCLPPQVPMIQCDGDKLTSVIVNLIDNAVKYTDSGGRVDVRLRFDDACVMIEVEDSGVGIEPARLETLFDILEKPSGRGVGIGLQVSKHIVEEHGGQLSVESQVGAGSRFMVTLPIGTAADDGL